MIIFCNLFLFSSFFRNSANQFGVGGIYDRVLTELVSKMREMKMDKTELGCLRTIILFNPGNKILSYYSLMSRIYRRVTN